MSEQEAARAFDRFYRGAAVVSLTGMARAAGWGCPSCRRSPRRTVARLACGPHPAPGPRCGCGSPVTRDPRGSPGPESQPPATSRLHSGSAGTGRPRWGRGGSPACSSRRTSARSSWYSASCRGSGRGAGTSGGSGSVAGGTSSGLYRRSPPRRARSSVIWASSSSSSRCGAPPCSRRSRWNCGSTHTSNATRGAPAGDPPVSPLRRHRVGVAVSASACRTASSTSS